MSRPIEDYALIGDTETAALVSNHGSIDWLCLPRFDGGACFAGLLGDDDHGSWRLAPAGAITAVDRRYRPGTLVLETELTCADGVVRLIDFMPPRGHDVAHPVPDVVRIVEGVAGRVPVHMELTVRFDYGWVVPWVTSIDGGLRLVAGPDALTLTTPVELRGVDRRTVADFVVEEGERVPFVLSWHHSTEEPPPRLDADQALSETCGWWEEWSAASTYDGAWPEAVERSLVTLKGLTYGPTGAIVAAPTTSLPEHLGGGRNWDYRYTWVRDATFTLYTLLLSGYEDEALAWRDWLLRAVAGDPSHLQIMYGIAGERRLTEIELDWLPGYEDSRPVRIGNAAYRQHQLDIYGELLDMLHVALRSGVEVDPEAWEVQRVLLEHLEGDWEQPDNSLWEIRGTPQHFTHSKVMAWVAFDRACRTARMCELEAPVARWRALAQEIHREICDRGYDAERNTFTQTYDGDELDAALLLIPQVGFLDPTDERVRGTVRAVEAELTIDDTHVLRYRTASGVDGLEGHEGTFLFCSFWLVDALALTGRQEEARALYERLLDIRNDVGLLAEEYDPATGRMLGNFPQAFSHVGLVNSAANIYRCATTPSTERAADAVRPTR